ARDLPADAAAATLERALGLWHGPAYGAFADSEIAQLEALRLEERRRSAVERLGAALTDSGRPGDAVSVLRPFVGENPLREGARIALMRALHADGRTSEGLEEYQRHRTHLAEELGLEPSAAMKGAQAELLKSSGSSAPSPQRGQ